MITKKRDARTDIPDGEERRERVFHIRHDLIKGFDPEHADILVSGGSDASIAAALSAREECCSGKKGPLEKEPPHCPEGTSTKDRKAYERYYKRELILNQQAEEIDVIRKKDMKRYSGNYEAQNKLVYI